MKNLRDANTVSARRNRIRSTYGLRSNYIPISSEIRPYTPPPEPKEGFEKDIFSLLDLMIEIHKETYGEKPPKIKMGRFERDRLKKFIEYGGTEPVIEYYYPDNFPLTEVTHHLGDKEHKVNVLPPPREKVTHRKKYYFRGMEIVKTTEFFHLEPIN